MTDQIAKPSQTDTKPLRLTPKGMAQMTMLTNGVDAKTALLLTNPYKDTISREAVHKLRAKYKRYSLQAPGTVKLAHNQIKRILQGEEREVTQQKVTKEGQVVEYTETIVPSDTNIIAAASMVYDRYEPAVKVNVSMNLDVDPIDLSAYRNKQSGAITSKVVEVELIEPVDNSNKDLST